ncbi:Ferulic acid decarboxylase 1 [Paecilomyces lecythidis]|uniref:Ferulic acid decarboxylase 1 n=1 Tax=Paecilomyces lecythidis TaxID=3004212 RepID=A0ABR3XG41_9EURO
MAHIMTSRNLVRTILFCYHAQFRVLSTSAAQSNVRNENEKPHLNFRSLISVLREQDDLVDIKEAVSTDLEVAAITRRVYETLAPAPLFHNISGTGSKNGLFKILGAPVGLRENLRERYARIALQLGLPVTSSPRDIIQKLIDTKNGKPLPPVPVSDAPVKQNILKREQIDLTKWPIPRLHYLDGGNYLGTYGFHVVETLDKSWTSWSISRTMHIANEPRSLTAPVMDGQHISHVRKTWIDSGAEDTPWALVLGGPPAAAFVAGMPLPAKVSEDGYIGALCGSPVEVVKCETNDLYVPANSELVVEGRISTSKSALEGPMGEYHGYLFQDEPVDEPLFQIDCVTHRNNPIVPISVAGTTPDETHTVWGISIAAEIMDVLEKNDFPVDFVWMPFEAQSCWIVVSVDIKKLATLAIDAKELCRRAGDIIFKTHAGWEAPKVLLVGDDVDITDINQIVWALATRYRPGSDEHVFGDIEGIPMLPYMTRARKNKQIRNPGIGGRSVMNLLLPSEFEGKRDWVQSSFTGAFPEELTEKVMKKWKHWFPE